MKMSDLRPAGHFAEQYGAKMVVYGGPGMGKTPLINTAPRPLLIAHEPGLLSMRGSNVPTITAFDMKTARDVYAWLFNSNEVGNFDTICIDSGSEFAEISLSEAKAKSKDGRKHYGIVFDDVMPVFRSLYYMKNKHVYLISKLGSVENGKKATQDNGVFSVETVMQKQPLYPGNAVPASLKHLYDYVLFMDWYTPPGYTRPVKAFFTQPCDEYMARDRSGNLAPVEPADNLTSLINKMMAQSNY